ncbi:hypothetical protein UFOVP253_11 [uncultured Caudovirales phage]|uniref:Uncharacterized protein n=1 Tax=uncultured Caudovirales phage TaxID=2100421 RepID=A0A6J5LGG6_9CAUD|nr:hypothetical protein UFOVP253_11 [uncultured Caudovirales phage]
MSTAADDLRKQIRDLPRTTNTDFRFPIDAYEDDIIAVATAYADARVLEDRKARLQEIEAAVIENYKVLGIPGAPLTRLREIMGTKQYYKKKLVNQNIEVEYSNETDEISIRIERKLKMGAHMGYDYLTIHPSYVEPLYKLLKAVMEP